MKAFSRLANIPKGLTSTTPSGSYVRMQKYAEMPEIYTLMCVIVHSNNAMQILYICNLNILYLYIFFHIHSRTYLH